MPFFFTSFLIILKSLGLGKGPLDPEQVELFYDKVNDARWQHEVDTSVAALVSLHSITVLLSTAANPVQELGTDHAGKYLVPAYSEEEVGPVGNAGWIFDDAPNVIKKIEQENDTDFGRLFADQVLGKTTIGELEQPLLQHFLDKFRNLELSPGFDPLNCLQTCRTSAAQIQFHNKTGPHAAMALSLLERLWGTEIKDHLEIVQGWLAAAGAPAGDEAWLEDKLQLEALNGPLTNLLNSSDDKAKLTMSKVTALADANGRAFRSMWNRFVDDVPSNETGLESLIGKFQAEANAAGLPQEEQEAWSDLLAATYGLIAWQLFDKTSLAVKEARLILRSLN
jgi:hypothetical protein